jgi:thioredoxin 1
MAASKNVIAVTDATFDAEVLKATTPVIIDFWAPWCGPCRAIAPVIEEIADAYQGRVKVAKVNVDEDTRAAANYNITAIPTILFFKEGKVADQIIGAASRSKITEKIDRLL